MLPEVSLIRYRLSLPIMILDKIWTPHSLSSSCSPSLLVKSQMSGRQGGCLQLQLPDRFPSLNHQVRGLNSLTFSNQQILFSPFSAVFILLRAFFFKSSHQDYLILYSLKNGITRWCLVLFLLIKEFLCFVTDLGNENFMHHGGKFHVFSLVSIAWENWALKHLTLSAYFNCLND